jgi:hypothetical protein
MRRSGVYCGGIETKIEYWVSLNFDSLCPDQENSNRPTTENWVCE